MLAKDPVAVFGGSKSAHTPGRFLSPATSFDLNSGVHTDAGRPWPAFLGISFTKVSVLTLVSFSLNSVGDGATICSNTTLSQSDVKWRCKHGDQYHKIIQS